MTGNVTAGELKRLEDRLWWVWLFVNALVGITLASLTLNAVRVVKVDQRINVLEAEKSELLRERAELKAALAARR